MDIFIRYHVLWQGDRDQELKDFLANEPRVSEFEAKIKFYENLATDIKSQSEFLAVGPLAIFTGMFLNHRGARIHRLYHSVLLRTFKICSATGGTRLDRSLRSSVQFQVSKGDERSERLH